MKTTAVMRNCPRLTRNTALFSYDSEHRAELAVALVKQVAPLAVWGSKRAYHGCRTSVPSARSWNPAAVANCAATGSQMPSDISRSGGRWRERERAGRVKPMSEARTVV